MDGEDESPSSRRGITRGGVPMRPVVLIALAMLLPAGLRSAEETTVPKSVDWPSFRQNAAQTGVAGS